MIILYKILRNFSDLKNRCPHEPCKAIFQTFTKNNGTFINVQLLMVMEKFKFFKNLLMGKGAWQKTENFWQIEKKSVMFTDEIFPRGDRENLR